MSNIDTLPFLRKRLVEGNQFMIVLSMQDSPFIVGQNLVQRPFSSRGEKALIVDKTKEPFVIGRADVGK